MSTPPLPALNDLVKVVNPDRLFFGGRGVVTEEKNGRYRLESIEGIKQELWYFAYELKVLETAQKETTR